MQMNNLTKHTTTVRNPRKVAGIADRAKVTLYVRKDNPLKAFCIHDFRKYLCEKEGKQWVVIDTATRETPSTIAPVWFTR